MKSQKTLILLAVLATVALNVATVQAGKRSGGGSRSGGRSLSSLRSAGMKAGSSFGGGFGSKKNSFSTSNLNRRNLTTQFQKKMATTQPRTQLRTLGKSSTVPHVLHKATTQPQLRIKQGVQQRITNHVKHHIKHHTHHQTHHAKCAPAKICHPPKHDHCHKVWWHSWIKPCVKPVVIHCPVVQPVPTPFPVPVPTPVVENPSEPVVPAEPELPRTEVMVGTQIVLDGAGFGAETGQIRLSVAGLSLLAPIVEWKEDGVILGVPPMDMAAPTDAELIVSHADGTTLQSLPITLVPAAS